jgi:hypothetical protein
LSTGSKNQKISVPRYYPVSGPGAISGRRENASISAKGENDDVKRTGLKNEEIEKGVDGD